MSMVAIPFAVDIDKVRRVFGCKDRELLQKIRTAGLYDNYASQSRENPDPRNNYNFDAFLEDIIMQYKKPEDRNPRRSFLKLLSTKTATGLNANSNTAHGYGYALLVICDYLGTHLIPYCDGFYHCPSFNAAVTILKGQGLEVDLGDMFELHAVFDIPKTIEAPAIRLFTKEEIEHINEIVERVEVDEAKTDFENIDFDEVQDWLKYIKDSFRVCKENGLEMITFAH